MLRATRTIDRRNSRMVKRRNSPYAPHKRYVPLHVPVDATPTIVRPQPERERSPQRKTINDFGWTAFLADSLSST